VRGIYEIERLPVIVSLEETTACTETYGFAGTSGRVFLKGQRIVSKGHGSKGRVERPWVERLWVDGYTHYRPHSAIGYQTPGNVRPAAQPRRYVSRTLPQPRQMA
jgi:hypothetical protein